MKVMLAADIHLEHSVRSDNSRGELASSIVLDELLRITREEQPDILFVLGDLFDAFGRIQAGLAMDVKTKLLSLVEGGMKLVLLAGNHDLEDVREEFFGKSIVSVLFSGLEALGVFVIDEKARFVDVGGGYTLLGIPYRESWEQFEASCLKPIEDALASGEVNPKTTKVITGWHCGLPLGAYAVMAGDENENGWIVGGHPAVELLFDLTHGRTIYLGHYHAPTAKISVPFAGSKKKNHFQYVGSPATRSRTESEQEKRVIILEDGKERVVPTGLTLDKVVATPAEARAFIASMQERFGDGILPVLRVSVVLEKGSSLDDFNIAREATKNFDARVDVDRPEIVKRSPIDDLSERRKTDENYTPADMDGDILLLAVTEHYRGREAKGFSRAETQKFVEAGAAAWEEVMATDDPAKSANERFGTDKITAESVALFHRLVLTLEEAKDIVENVA